MVKGKVFVIDMREQPEASARVQNREREGGFHLAIRLCVGRAILQEERLTEDGEQRKHSERRGDRAHWGDKEGG